MEQVRQLLAELPLPAQLWDPTGAPVFTNQHFNQLFSRPPGNSWQESGDTLCKLPGWVGGQPSAACQRALAGERATAEGLVFQAPPVDGMVGMMEDYTKVVDLQLIPLFGRGSGLAGVVCLAQQHLGPSILQEHEMMRAQRMENLETLAASVAHEFNNLFTGIRGLADLIRDETQPGSDAHEFASSIQSSVMRGADLVARLSGFAQELPHQLRSRSLNDYLDRALPVLQLQATKRVQIEFLRGPDYLVLLDNGRLDQALANLFSNSKDAMGGSGRVRISTGCISIPASPAPGSPSSEWVFIQVEDSGPGIPTELRGQVTQPFFTTKDRGKATGLGLAMTRRIVSLHNGGLEIGASEDLGGACIRILLPAIRQSQPTG